MADVDYRYRYYPCQGEVLVLGPCSASVTEVETMLGQLARQVITSSNQL